MRWWTVVGTRECGCSFVQHALAYSAQQAIEAVGSDDPRNWLVAVFKGKLEDQTPEDVFNDMICGAC